MKETITGKEIETDEGLRLAEDSVLEKDALDAALDGDENVDLKALVFELFETVDSIRETPDLEEADPETAEAEGQTETADKTGTTEAIEKTPKKQKKSKRSVWKYILIANTVILTGILAWIFFSATPDVIKGLKVTGSTYNSTSIKWEKSENAKGYRIYRSEDGKHFDYIDMTDVTSYSDKRVRTGTTYYYMVSARNGIKSSKTQKKNAVSVTPSLEEPELKVNTDNGAVELSFTPVSGAVGYKILRNGKQIATTAETSYTDEKAKGDKDYTYEVKAFRYKKKPVYSDASNAVKTKLETVGELIIETAGDGLTLKWNPAEVYTSFKLYDGEELLDTIHDSSYHMSGFDIDKTYDIRIIGYSEDEKKRSPEEEKRFKIAEEPMDNEGAIEAAVQWGIDIANDDSFTYGTGMRAHRCGCYFCGTNVGPVKNKKGKSLVNGHSYAKTYCCNPFVHACFAHGAGDQNMLNACKNGKSVSMTVGSFTRYGHWKSAGKPAYSDLRRGDVIVSNSHVMLYIGDGQVVHAGSEGWDSGSICIDNLSPGYYKSYDFVMRYTGTGSGTMYVIREIGEDGKVIPENKTEDNEA